MPPRLVLIAFLGLVPNVLASPTYRALIPNGNQVPHPCARSQVWGGVGHQSPDGGGPLNPFGADFLKANKTWTPLLCRMDSDGDGLTNGQELGDPYCIWTSGTLPTVREPNQLSHPGICEPINSAICATKNDFLTRFCSRPDSMVPTTPGTPNFCQLPDTPQNAYVVNNSPSRNGYRYVAGDFVQYDCNRGYQMTGGPTIYCQGDGSWTVKPSCTIPPVIATAIGICPGVLPPENGYILRSSTQQSNSMYAAGDTVEFACSVGYTIQGNSTITCLNTGAWSWRPSCKTNLALPESIAPVYCPAPITPANGYIANRQPLQIYQQYSVGDMLAYSCEIGFRISNRAAIQCMADGSWSAPVPVCLPAVGGNQLSCTCPKPDLPENAFISSVPGSAISTEYNIGDLLQINCVQGFVIATKYSIIQCNSDGYWQPTTMPFCRRNVRSLDTPYCSTPIPPDHGFILSGSSLQPNGDTNYGYYSVGDEVRFSCIPGYRLVGEPTVRCRVDGTWYGQQLPICQRITDVDTSVTCDVPTLPANGLIQSQSKPWTINQVPRYIIGSFVMFGCQVGYLPTGNARSTIMCQKGGTWTTTSFSCTPVTPPPVPPVTCLAPPPPTNAYIFASSPTVGYNRYAVWDFIQYSCMDGFASDDRPVTICQPSGTFAPKVNMTCIRIARAIAGQISCLAPSLPLNAYLTQVSPLQVGNRYNVGESIQYACNDGYSTSDATIIQCLTDATWSSQLPRCRRNDKYSAVTTPCPSPPVPDNSFVMNSAPNRIYYAGDVIQYGCNDGYSVAGTSNRASCLNDGRWMQLYFACQRNVRISVTLTTCNPPVVPNNGYIMSRSLSLVGQRYSPNDYVQYSCNSGFSMVGNSTNICNPDGTWSGAPICLRINP